MDPAELGSNLSALRCPACKTGDVLPRDPVDLKSDLECSSCGKTIDASAGKMMLDTSMKFVGSGRGQTATGEHTLEILAHLDRFLKPTHCIIQDLKVRYLSQIIAMERDKDGGGGEVVEGNGLTTALDFCRDLLGVVGLVSPGESRFRGSYHRKQIALNYNAH